MHYDKMRVIVFSLLAALLILLALFAPYLCPYDPNQQNLSAALQAPNAEHLLGTDRYGRDMISRVIFLDPRIRLRRDSR